MIVRFCTFLTTIALAVPAGAQLEKILSGNGASDASLSAAGLKEALRIGTDHAIELTGGSFKKETNQNPAPDELRPLERVLRLAPPGAQAG